MEKKDVLLALIPQQGLLPLYFYKDSNVSIEVLKALYSAGIRAVEYTNRGEAALQNFKNMRKICDTELKGMYLGIGTIKNAEMARIFIDAGTDYIICPGLVEEVASEANKNNMLWVPGCMTPSEIIRAETLGATIIKLFPGNILGPGFVSAIKEIFPGLLFMPTGGVELDKANLAGWFKAGVCAVGMGSKLITRPLLDEKNYAQITAATQEVLSIIQSIKS
ncbi:MAG: bifunctional 4-hydroxy-2-oxoglutarate aldolase/2-dehydro-3-deoxy-phosphogluconate aldolase [Chitinophagaceae bacterium]|nr:bifunctional 4-hydroxy-2-oxoglutarate aldolase/2-dehydro-3-deoxy-phosphogluconate aldolase [Chitinophagaceae bacterium]MDP1762646.1 bifunctional 4-hydroxy-2-oxoglutarate aldolase/2-dehydro-3-deoxy-phosphogluconate aldolase [Sediminibacterium sp.]MDP1810092.1 bifunctional 4-hydroxy-2-oxoglutarate aldolase/2-dehydro-3-deoxy-phosphogluconate aldolase [Sediminibacterium sp.]MDP3127798.1 bifunctional 4-hydroxy-2-oxoglutarate aldolase/2-dehydro-3-deoxy-phosphogluconate aldolase [Sediminibacterium s